MYSKKNGILINVYENIDLSFFENTKSNDSILNFLMSRLQWPDSNFGAYIQCQKIVK